MSGPYFRRKWIAGATGLLLFVLSLWLVLPMVRGCAGLGGPFPGPPAGHPNAKQPPQAADKPKPKPDFEKLKITALPHDGQDLTQGLKPGHWASATLAAKANNFDFTGELIAEVTSNNRPVDLEHTAYRLLSTRPAGLPKGQDKRLELLFFPPRSVTTNLAIELDGPGGTEVLQDSQPFRHLPAYQYFMYVLSSQPGRYTWLRVLDTVRPPWDDLSNKDRNEYYRVLLPHVGHHVGLPSQPLVWSSIAIILWDDIHPKVLTADQQQALLDWLHWGGQILISGPRTLDLLRGSFLDAYLPADGAESLTLDEAALADFNEYWTVRAARAAPMPLAVTQPWPAVRLKLRAAGSFVPGTGKLLAERRVGRGRIAVCAFRLTERDLIAWRSFDSFFNNALLRRPPRAYTAGEFGDAVLDWVQWLPSTNGAIERPYRTLREARLDPELVTNVRYFSRDGGTSDARSKLAEAAGVPADIREDLSPRQTPSDGLPATSHVAESQRLAAAAHEPGVGGWTDFSPVANAARESLREAAGIVIPDRTFVVWMIGVYLAIIVPLNWLVFRVIGRVEWAWVAVPLIAVASAFAVIRMARLDIGFARSKSEIAIVEFQGDYARAHVTRFTALYTSLSTAYEVQFDDRSALAAPFSTNPAFRLLTGQQATPVMYRRDAEVHLTGFQVSSNSTGMLRTEVMHALGAFNYDDKAGQTRLVSNAAMVLEGASILRRSQQGLEAAWVGTLGPRDAKVLSFLPLSSARIAERMQIARGEAKRAGHIHLQPLFEIAMHPESLSLGDVRLVAWTQSEVPGIDVRPSSSQQHHATMIVANLRTALGPRPTPDANTRTEAHQGMNDGQ